jgi:hypothetical protein
MSLCVVKGDTGGYFLMRRVSLTAARSISGFLAELRLRNGLECDYFLRAGED